MSKITFEDKVDLVENTTLPEKNKLTAQNINDIKRAINESASLTIDGKLQEELSLSTTRDTTVQKLHVQVKTTDGKLVMIETSTDDVYLGDTKLTDIFSLFRQFINITSFYSENPTAVLAALNQVLPN